MEQIFTIIAENGKSIIEFEVSAIDEQSAKKRVEAWFDCNFQADSFGYILK